MKRRAGVIGICLDCGKSFTPFRRILMRCDECRLVTCPGCGTVFRRDRPGERYCTNECRKAGKPKITCAHCGKVVTVYRYRADRAQYCSISCGRVVVSRAIWAVAGPERRQQAADHIAAIGRARGQPRPNCLDCGVQLKTLRAKRCHACVNLASPRGVALRPPESLADGWYARKRAAGYRTDIERIVEQRLIEL